MRLLTEQNIENIALGATAMIALYAATVRDLKQCAILGTMSKAEQIGRTILRSLRTWGRA